MTERKRYCEGITNHIYPKLGMQLSNSIIELTQQIDAEYIVRECPGYQINLLPYIRRCLFRVAQVFPDSGESASYCL